MEKQIPKSMTMYIPSNLNIKKLLEENPPNFKHHPDHFIYLVHLITYLPTVNDERDDQFVSFYSPLLQRTNRHYRNYLDYLIENGVIVENRQYVPGVLSRGYAFTRKYETEITTTKITYYCLIKNILNFKDVTKVRKEDATVTSIETYDRLQQVEHLTKWFNGKLTVDYSEAKAHLVNLRQREESEWLKKILFQSPPAEIPKSKKRKKKEKNPATPMQKYNRRILVLKKIQSLQFLPNVDQVAGRLHTVLTQAISGLRPFIKYDGKELVAVDVTNSQPYLAISLLNYATFERMQLNDELMRLNPHYTSEAVNHKKLREDLIYAIRKCNNSENARLYKSLVVSGKFYEQFAKILENDPHYNETEVTRGMAKEVVFSAVFSRNNAVGYNQAIVLFKKHFPDVYKVFSLIKKNKHNTLACLLQTVEAKLVLQKACRIISEERPDLPIFTLHDSIVTTKGDEVYVHEILNTVLLEEIGEKPTLKYEPWSLVG